MKIMKDMLATTRRYRQARAEREALRLLLARKDARLLRDAGLALVEDVVPRCAPLPQAAERRWSAPLLRRKSYWAFSPESPPASWTSFRNSAR